MRYTILLNKDEKTKAVESQEQARFVKSMLEALDVPIEFNPDEPLTIEAKRDFRKALNTYNLHVISDVDGGLKVYSTDELIGEWKKARYVLKSDPFNIEPNKRLFLEMYVETWSIFEEQPDGQMKK